MTITDLKRYADKMNAKMLPTDKLQVVLSRRAVTIVGAYLADRKKSLEQALGYAYTSPKKREKREYELTMVNEALAALEKSERI